ALGYWRNPSLTTAAFGSDSDYPERRTYRSGDLGRLLPDGSIMFLGRKDNQVKVNGYRVELGDVQAAVNEHPEVVDAVVLQREHGDDTILVAYFVPRHQPGPDVAALRS